MTFALFAVSWYNYLYCCSVHFGNNLLHTNKWTV